MDFVSMKFLGVDIDVKNLPELDTEFIPLGAFIDGYLRTAGVPVAFAVARPGGAVSVFDTFIHDTQDMREADRYFASRIVKFLLWAYGGAEVIVCGNEDIAGHIRREYSVGGALRYPRFRIL